MGVETFLTKYVSWAALKSQHNVVEIVVWPLKVSRKRVLGADNKDFVKDCHTRVTNKLDLIIYFALAQKDPKIQVTLNKIIFTTTNMLLAPRAHIFFVRSMSTGGVHPAWRRGGGGGGCTPSRPPFPPPPPPPDLESQVPDLVWIWNLYPGILLVNFMIIDDVMGWGTWVACNLQVRNQFLMVLAKVKNDAINQFLFSRRLTL